MAVLSDGRPQWICRLRASQQSGRLSSGESEIGAPNAGSAGLPAIHTRRALGQRAAHWQARSLFMASHASGRADRPGRGFLLCASPKRDRPATSIHLAASIKFKLNLSAPTEVRHSRLGRAQQVGSSAVAGAAAAACGLWRGGKLVSVSLGKLAKTIDKRLLTWTAQTEPSWHIAGRSYRSARSHSKPAGLIERERRLTLLAIGEVDGGADFVPARPVTSTTDQVTYDGPACALERPRTIGQGASWP